MVVTTCEWVWSTPSAHAQCISLSFSFRQAKIAENMQKMPQMIADYRRKMHELRDATRKKQQRTEEEEYLLATGKKQQEGPSWQVFKDSSRRKPKY